MSKQGEGKIDRLRKNIRQHDILYYVKDSPTISDREYDLLMRELQDLEGKFERAVDIWDKPRQIVAAIHDYIKNISAISSHDYFSQT